jgi:nitrogen fixation NifU-like protein
MKPTGAYTKKVLDLFKKPHNYGSIKNADGIGTVGNIVCGDVMKLYIKIGEPFSAKGLVEKGSEIIKDIKFETFGCVAAISTSSIITDLAKGKTIKEALEITKDKVVDSLGGLPKIKFHCSVLAVDALAEAIYDYLAKNKKEIPVELIKIHERIKVKKS